MPALRWRQGEYQALLRLTNHVKDRIVPFITIPDIEFDFEEGRPKKTVQEHVKPFPARYKSKWGKRPAWIGAHNGIVQAPMDDGRHIFSYAFEELRRFDANAVPSVPVTASVDTAHAVAAIVRRDDLGLAISVRLEDLMKATPLRDVRTLASVVGADLSDIDLIVDLAAPNFEPYGAFANALILALRKFGSLDSFRNFVVIGTAIPQTFGDIAKGFDEIPRHDWLFYQHLFAALPAGTRHPNFGDYTIVHPEFTAVDMRMIKSAAKIVYTTPDNWAIRKGSAFRDNPGQMHGHCADLVGRSIFKGAAYSSGDDYIAKCATRREGPSNQTRWKEVAINHHITHAVDDLAKLSAVP